MYQVEKLEEEEAKRKERTEEREEDEVEMNVMGGFGVMMVHGGSAPHACKSTHVRCFTLVNFSEHI